jgi:hypothetical protein
MAEPGGAMVFGDHDETSPGGSFESVKELQRAIMDYIHHGNESGRQFLWTKSSKQILRNIRKGAQD